MKIVNMVIAAAFFGMMLVIVTTVVFTFDATDFYSKRSFLLPQGAMMAMGALGLTLIGVLAERDKGEKAHRLLCGLFWLAIFAVQAFSSYCAYFFTDWDPRIVFASAYSISGYGVYWDLDYFRLNPNNAFLTLVFSAVLKVFRCVVGGEPGEDRCLIVLIVAQCAVNTLAGALTQWAAWKLTGRRSWARAAAVVYVLLIGLSPWVRMTYSDSMGLIFPVAILSVYLKARESEKKTAYSMAIGGLTGIAYLIKPQTAIITIALTLVSGARLLSDGETRRALKCAAVMAATIFLAVLPGANAIIHASPIVTDKARQKTMLHSAMMGLNPEHNGEYFEDDTKLIDQYPPGERETIQLEVIRQRMSAMGFDGYMKLMHKKLLANYADGSFGWGNEGYFFNVWVAEKNAASPVIRDWIDSRHGSRWPYLQAFFQSVWLGILTMAMLSPIAFHKSGRGTSHRDALAVMMLALIGLTLFEMIFETRARYLFTYVPIDLLVGLMGLQAALKYAKESRKKKAIREN